MSDLQGPQTVVAKGKVVGGGIMIAGGLAASIFIATLWSSARADEKAFVVIATLAGLALAGGGIVVLRRGLKSPVAAAPAVSQNQGQVKQPIPGWAWIFAAACAAIPIVSLGGAIPGALGFGAAGGCVGAARNPKQSMGVRVAICMGITVAAWALFALFLLAIVSRSTHR